MLAKKDEAAALEPGLFLFVLSWCARAAGAENLSIHHKPVDSRGRDGRLCHRERTENSTTAPKTPKPLALTRGTRHRPLFSAVVDPLRQVQKRGSKSVSTFIGGLGAGSFTLYSDPLQLGQL